MVSTTEKIRWAVKVLNLPETATMKLIKQSYRDLMIQWHPDTCNGDPDLCKRMTQQINLAYDIVLNYCENYDFSFKENDLIRTARNESGYDEWWNERFGDDPLWGPKKTRKL
ncbi:MAG: J domain-containing protein [Methanotrichaceae archaeon]